MRLFKIRPTSLRDRLRMTEDKGLRDTVRLAERLVEDKLKPVHEKAVKDVLIYGTAVIPYDWNPN